MEFRTTSLKSKIIQNLHWGEALFGIVTLIGAILRFTSGSSSQLLLVGASGLAAVYFLYTYQKSEAPAPAEGEQFGFKELLAWNIIPKILWIGTSAMVIGLLFKVLPFQGYQQMLMIGTAVVGSCLISLIPLSLSKAGITNSVKQALLRIVPIFMISVYSLML